MNTHRPFFSNAERIACLEAVAESWTGTPYVASGAVKGSGASCHGLVAAAVAEAGFPIGEVPPRGAIRKRDYSGTMIAWMDRRPTLFRQLIVSEAIWPGDILVMDLGIGHLALGLTRDRLLQVLRNQPAHITTLNDARLRSRIRTVFRPLDPDGQ